MRSSPRTPVEGLTVNYNGGHSLEQVTATFEVDMGDVRATTAHTDRIRSNAQGSKESRTAEVVLSI